MGRNGKSWAKITVFFLIFYGCLAGFFAAMLTAFLATVPERSEGPKLTQYLADKPGITAVPNEIKPFGYGNSDSYAEYVDVINWFLKPYLAQTGADEGKYDTSFCSFEGRSPRPKDQKKQCRYDLTQLGPCWKNDTNFKFGYDEGEPCIFFRMNKIFNWIPEPNGNLSHVVVSCKPAENDTQVYPDGFPVSFFPYRIEDNWLGPLVAIKVNLKSAFTMKCDLEARNVEKSTSYRMDRGAYGRLQIKIGKRNK